MNSLLPFIMTLTVVSTMERVASRESVSFCWACLSCLYVSQEQLGLNMVGIELLFLPVRV